MVICQLHLIVICMSLFSIFLLFFVRNTCIISDIYFNRLKYNGTSFFTRFPFCCVGHNLPLSQDGCYFNDTKYPWFTRYVSAFYMCINNYLSPYNFLFNHMIVKSSLPLLPIVCPTWRHLYHIYVSIYYIYI